MRGASGAESTEVALEEVEAADDVSSGDSLTAPVLSRAFARASLADRRAASASRSALARVVEDRVAGVRCK